MILYMKVKRQNQIEKTYPSIFKGTVLYGELPPDFITYNFSIPIEF